MSFLADCQSGRYSQSGVSCDGYSTQFAWMI